MQKEKLFCAFVPIIHCKSYVSLGADFHFFFEACQLEEEGGAEALF